MVGGAGDDTYYVDEAGDRVVEAAFGGIDLVVTSLSAYTLGTNLENLSFTGFSGFLGTGNDVGNRLTGGLLGDTLRGGAGQDYLFGLLGNDLLEGGLDGDGLFGDYGNDTLDGGAGADFLDGGKGRDLLLGGDGADRLLGGDGADTLTGGAGADRFVYGSVTQSTTAARDLITDFTKGGVDRLDLSAIDANPNLAGDQAFIWLGRTQDTDPTRPTVGSLWARENATGTEIRADLNGDGVVDFAVKLANAWWLSAADIVL
jgi:Ca2+-binding RTX toxin-like protein